MDWKTCFQGKHLLLVEDDPVNVELMDDILTGMSISFDLAKDGNEAVQKAKEKKYDLILMDIRLPEKDGFTATQEIKSSEGLSKVTPIFALTASVLDTELKKIKEAGFADYIEKPMDLHSFREKIAKVLLPASTG